MNPRHLIVSTALCVSWCTHALGQVDTNAAASASSASAASTLGLGLFGGWFTSSLGSDSEDRTLDGVRGGFALGARLGYYPLRILGIEAEFSAARTFLSETGASATWLTPRAQAVLVVPLRAVQPFLLAGAGRIIADGVGEDKANMAAIHFGAGMKFPLSTFASLRMDVRDEVLPSDEQSASHRLEWLLGLQARFPAAHEGSPSAQPRAVSDSPQRAAPRSDVKPRVGPIRQRAALDRDGDGLVDDRDACPEAAESDNGFEDQDGCPDLLPPRLRLLSRTVRDIEFSSGSDRLLNDSREMLDQLAAILAEFPDIGISVTVHTDNWIPAEQARQLTQLRAEAIRTYLIERGAAHNPIQARGAGSDEPIADNSVKSGRALNRRIEFRILSTRNPVHEPAP